MTTINIANLAARLLKETFGEIVADIYLLIIKKSLCSLKDLCQHFTSIPKAKIKSALLILLHHHFLTWDGTDNTVYYMECHTTTVSFMRCQHYMLTTKERYGRIAENLVDALIKDGSVTASQAIINAWIKVTKYLKVQTTIETLVKEFQFLVENEYVQRCPKLREPGQKEYEDVVDPDLRFCFPPVHELIISLKQETSSYTDIEEYSIFPNNVPTMKHPDSKIYWKMNYKRFDADLRDKSVRRYICEATCKEAGPIFDTMLRIASRKCNRWDKLLGPVSVAEIQEIMNPPHLARFFPAMNRGRCKGIIEPFSEFGGGEYHINMGVALKILSESIVDSRVLKQFGSKVHRVYRTLRMEGMLEKASIEKFTMMGSEETNKAIVLLMDEMYVMMREIRKGNSISTAPGNLYVLYYVDLPFVIRNLHSFAYKAMFNMNVILSKKAEDNKVLIDKNKTMEQLADHLKLVNLESLPELEELITPEEKESVQAVHASMNRYIANIVKTQYQAFIFELFSFYQAVDAHP